MSDRLHGCLPIVLTPFDEGGAIDVASLVSEVEFLIESGVHGLATPAIASEGYKLSDEERMLVSRTVVETTAGRVPVVVSADGAGTDLAKMRARSAAALGADALMVLPPSFVKPDTMGLEQYYVQVAEAGGLPIMVQDAPQLTGVTITVDNLMRINTAAPLVSSVKLEGLPAGQKTTDVLQRMGGRMDVFAGWGGLGFWEGLNRGAIGCMPAANLGPALAGVYESYRDGHLAQGAAAFDRLVPFMAWSMQSIDLGIWCGKELLRRKGVITHAVMREPATLPDPVMRAEFERLVTACGAAL
jgi:4-hydroxy-tetrahydrodipicolinate synthase